MANETFTVFITGAPTDASPSPSALIPIIDGGVTKSITYSQTGAVSSVFGRSGAVVAASGDYSAFYDALGAAAAITLSGLGGVPTTRTISTTAPLAGGGDLSANRTFSISQSTTSTDGYLSSTDWNTFNGKQAALGFTAENVANKSTTTTLGTSNTLYPSQNAVKSYVDTNIALCGLLASANTWTNTNTFSSIVTFNNSVFLSGEVFDGAGDPASNNFVLTGVTGGTTQWKALPSASFSGLSSGTNSTAAMVVGTGASLTISGSGTINATTLGAKTFANPGPIGSTTASTGAFTTLSASSTVSGAGFSTYLASPPDIGGTARAQGFFTNLTAQVINLDGTNTNSSGTFNSTAFYPSYAQSGTASFNVLYVSPFLSSVGSGTKYLINLGTNSTSGGGIGTHTSKFTVDFAGNGNLQGSLNVAANLTVAAGSSGTPSINSGSNTGIFWTGAGGVLALESGGQNNVQISFNNVTIFSTLTNNYGAAASTPNFLCTGSMYTGGTGTTTMPYWYLKLGATQPTVFNTAGTFIGANMPSGYTGNIQDYYINGGSSIYSLDYLGNTVNAGNVTITTAGKGLILKSGSNARIGTGTLSGGTLTVANTSVTANTRVFLQDTGSSVVNVGSLTVVTTAGTGFVVTSTNALDTSTFNWMLIESS